MSPDWSATPAGVPYAHLEAPQSLNLYAYAGNDPVSGEDPDGHSTFWFGDGTTNNGDGLPEHFRKWYQDAVSPASQAAAASNYTEVIYQQQVASSFAAAQQQSASSLTDKNGNTVQGANGKPALIPGGFDANGVLKAGQADKELRGVAPMVGSKATAEDLANFGRGGKWDLQRLSGNFDPRFIDSATILIGMYAASAGVTRNQILNIENTVAIGSTYAKGTVMDSTYTHLPVRNVTNTDIGMRLIQSGAYVP